MILEIARNVPLWVPPLFVLLLVLGLKARHRRDVPVVLIYLIPLLSILSLRTLMGLPAGAWIWPVFMGLLGLGIWAGHRTQLRYLISRQGWRVTVAGEWMTLVLLMSVFSLNFAVRVLGTVAPHSMTFWPVHLLVAMALGIVSGMFVGRAFCVWRARSVGA